MTPRKPKSKPIAEVIASTIKRQRESQDWTQEQLAQKMREFGFTKWSRTTVAEVEGSGRGRQVTVPELLVLADLFGVGLEDLAWDVESQGEDRVALEITPTHILLSQNDLLLQLIAPERLVERAIELAQPAMRKQFERFSTEYIERVQGLARELRDVAGWFESEALQRLAKGKDEDK